MIVANNASVIVIVMGVSGAGKTTIGRLLAEKLGCPFLDADDLHSPESVAKMAAGTPLTDDDRWPWLAHLNAQLRPHRTAVLACSALKQSYRDRLVEGLANWRIVHLRGSLELIRERLDTRRHRYMPASLLESQFAALEAPANAITVEVAAPVARCVEAIVANLR